MTALAHTWPEAAPVFDEHPVLEELKARRQTLGLSLKEIGLRCGIDEASLRNWERGADMPRLDALDHWAAVLGMQLTLRAEQDKPQRGIVVDWERRGIAVDGAPVRLTPMEWKVLERLARAPGRLVSHQELFRHLYGEERDCRAQATAVRVLINKLRRLLPLRIEAQWGQGYVLDGIAAPCPHGEAAQAAPSPPQAVRCEARHEAQAVAILSLPEAAPCHPAVKPPRAAEVTAKAVGRHSGARPAVMAAPAAGPAAPAAPAAGPAPRRATELGEIERFMARRGVTRCPDPAAVARSEHPDLVWDKMKRKWVRPGAQDCGSR